MDKIVLLQKIIDEASNIVFFGGAGVSTDSGIKDFRGEKGLYQEKLDVKPEYLLSIRCFSNEPYRFFDFYKIAMNGVNTLPNITHKYLKKLEDKGALKAIITQNIDGLHQKAGSKKVYEIHGSIYQNHCLKCHKSYSAKYVFESKEIPKCTCGGIIKPDVTLYGEMLPAAFINAQYLIKEADTLIVAGTSLTVEPASSLIRLFSGTHLVIINNTETPYDHLANLVIHENLKDVFSKLK